MENKVHSNATRMPLEFDYASVASPRSGAAFRSPFAASISLNRATIMVDDFQL